MRGRGVVLGALVVMAVAAPAWAETYQVGNGKPYANLAALPALRPGDLVELFGDQTYPAHRFTHSGTPENKITIRGIRVNGRRPIISGGANNTVEAAGSHTVFEGLEITGGAARCFYHHADDVTLRDSLVRDCPKQGILGADSDSGSFLLEYVEVTRAGGGNPDRDHQIYMATDNERYPDAVFRMQFCWVHDGDGGNGVKSRAARNEIYYNWIENSHYHELELIGADGQPEGAVREDSDVVGNVLRKGGGNAGFFAVRLGGDGTGQSNGRYRFVNNTIIMAGTSAVFRLFHGIESLEAHNNVLFRNGGGAVTVTRDVEVSWVGGTRRMSGSNNWVSSGSTAPAEWTGTRTGASPGFENLGGHDLRPTMESPLTNGGNMAPAPTGTVVGHSIPSPQPLPLFVPSRAQLTPGTAPPRPAAGTIDIGALEYGSGPPITTPDAGVPTPPPDGGGGITPDGAAPGPEEADARGGGGAVDGAGCGCRAARGRSSGAGAAWLVAGLLLLAFRRTR